MKRGSGSKESVNERPLRKERDRERRSDGLSWGDEGIPGTRTGSLSCLASLVLLSLWERRYA
jgi:hypothetical protein